MLLAGILILGALAAWAVRGRLFPSPPATPAVAPAPKPGLTLQQESTEATRLVNAGHSMESLPYYRHLIAALPGDGRLRFNFVTAITNAALESRIRPHSAAPWARSSIERVEMMREGLAQLEDLERRSAGAHEKAIVRELRGRLYKNWGFPWDAATELRAAQKLDPAWRQVAANADFYIWLIHHPEANLDSIR